MDVEKLKKISYIATSFLLIAAMLLNVSLTSVKASEISSLPADAGVEVRYDSDNIYLTYNGESWTINRNTLVGSSAPTEYDYPLSWSKSFEMDHFGNAIPCSYWFSPSERNIYVVCSLRFAGNSQYTWFYDANMNHKIQSYSDGSFYYVQSEDYDTFSNRSRLYVYQLNLSDMSVAKFKSVQDVDSSDVIIDNGYPTDLVCLYSNYTISGFFELKPSETCYTPNYYFDYQYLFYVEDVGYTFIDSALPLVSISHPDPTHALLKFDDVCNKHIYTSVDGIEWTALYTVSGMYSDNASVDYKWFYDSAGGISVYQLVYCNDGTFDDEPIVTPEYGTVNDVVSNLWSIVYYKSQFEKLEYVAPNSKDWANAFEWFMYSSFSLDYVDFSFYHPNNGVKYSYSGISFRGLVEQIFYEMQNLRTVLNDEVDELTDVTHNDLKSVFDNITNTNLYLDKVIDTVEGLNIPDYNYFEKLNELIGLQANIKQLLTDMEFAVTLPENSDIVSTPFDDTEILDSLVEIDKSIDYIGGLITYQTVTDVFEDLGDNDDLLEVGDFINSAIASMASNTLLSGAFTYTDGITNGINWVNARVDSFYTASGNFKPVIILGAVFFVINLYIRRIN